VSIGGQPLQPTTLTGDQCHGSWQSWELPARVRERGSVTIQARATDTAGRTQPGRPYALGYAINPIRRIQIGLRPSTPGLCR
jgi:hypothetical protein